MKSHISKFFFLFTSVALAIATVIIFFEPAGAQEFPGLPKLRGEA
jgi:hypothetical protein